MAISISAGTSSSDIQTIIDTAPAEAVLEFEAGDYVIRDTLVINRSDITLQGAGSDETRFIQSGALQGEPVLQIGPDWIGQTTTELPKLAHEAQEGGRMLRFADGHGLEVGDVIYVSMENTPEFFEEIGDTQWQQDAPLRTIMVTVERVGGNSIAISERLPFDFDPALTTVTKMDPLEGVSVSSIEFTTTYGAADPSDFSNTISAEYRGSMIDIKNTDGLSFIAIEITNAGSLGINIASSIDADFDDITATGSHNKGSGGNGYGIQIRDVYDSSFTGLEIMDTRHGVLFSSYQTAIGNHIEITATNRDMNFHGGLDQDNTVIIESAIRTEEEQSYMSPVVYFNEGESWGAPTDPFANLVVIQETNGTVRADTIVADPSGAIILSSEGPDTVYGSDGDDFIFTESGHDEVYYSSGDDTIDGGSGTDRIVFDAPLSAYQILSVEDGFEVIDAGFPTIVTDFESFQFADQTLTSSQLYDLI